MKVEGGEHSRRGVLFYGYGNGKTKSGRNFFRRFSLLKIRSLGLSPLLLEVRNYELKNL